MALTRRLAQALETLRNRAVGGVVESTYKGLGSILSPDRPLSERSAQRVVAELVYAGFVVRAKIGCGPGGKSTLRVIETTTQTTSIIHDNTRQNPRQTTTKHDTGGGLGGGPTNALGASKSLSKTKLTNEPSLDRPREETTTTHDRIHDKHDSGQKWPPEVLALAASLSRLADALTATLEKPEALVSFVRSFVPERETTTREPVPTRNPANTRAPIQTLPARGSEEAEDLERFGALAEAQGFTEQAIDAQKAQLLAHDPRRVHAAVATVVIRKAKGKSIQDPVKLVRWLVDRADSFEEGSVACWEEIDSMIGRLPTPPPPRSEVVLEESSHVGAAERARREMEALLQRAQAETRAEMAAERAAAGK